jgi:hypothetical protein
LFVIVTGLVAVSWLMGADLDSEYRRTAWLSISDLIGAEPRGRRLSPCGVAQTVLPGSLEAAIPCAVWNIGSFYIIPALALLYAVKASLSRG